MPKNMMQMGGPITPSPNPKQPMVSKLRSFQNQVGQAEQRLAEAKPMPAGMQGMPKNFPQKFPNNAAPQTPGATPQQMQAYSGKRANVSQNLAVMDSLKRAFAKNKQPSSGMQRMQ